MDDYSAPVGTVALSLAEPWPGYERAYNRWYDRGHFYSGAMSGPGAMAGKRWVATARHKQLRYPATSRLLADVRAGSFFVTYLIEDGALERWQRWSMEEVRPQFEAQGKMFPQRDFVFTQFYDVHTTTARDEDGMPLSVSLDHPFAGLVALIIERPADLSVDLFSARLSIDVLGEWMPGSPIALATLLTPTETPEVVSEERTATVDESVRRLMLLSFVERDPADCWETEFAGLGARVGAAGLGDALLVAGFIPTIPGTDAYVDQLH